MSKYNNIQTAADLVREVKMNGLSTAQDDINRAADIIGRAPIKELVDLATDAQCTAENGFTTGKPSTSNTFYSIAFTVWHWEQAARFFAEHTLRLPQQLHDTQKQLKTETARADAAEAEATRCMTGWESAAESLQTAQARLKEATADVIQLKANLYDMMKSA